MREICFTALALATILTTAPRGGATAGMPMQASFACDAPEARAFDFWHGEWKVNNRYLTDDGWQDAGTADVRVYPALNGCLTIEHWRGNLGSNDMYGFSARAWDEQASTWVLLLSWPPPGQAGFGTLEGTFRHGRGEFFSEGTDEDGNPRHTRFSFADISPDSFRWDQAFSSDRESWRTTWIMEYSRRDRFADPPIFVEPATNTGRCPGAEHRAFDFLLGEWSAEVTRPGAADAGEQQAARLRAVPILGGCAVIDFFETVDVDPALEAFRIRLYENAEERWLQYSFDTETRVFEPFEQDLDADGLVLTAQDEGQITRIEWSDVDTEAPTWTVEVSEDEGATWSTKTRVRLSRSF